MWNEDRPMNSTVLNRRSLFRGIGSCIGWAALSSLFQESGSAQDAVGVRMEEAPGLHFAPTAKRVIFLHQSGGPSQIDLFDPKPVVTERHGQQMPASVLGNDRLTTMTANQKAKPLTASPFSRTSSSDIRAIRGIACSAIP